MCLGTRCCSVSINLLILNLLISFCWSCQKGFPIGRELELSPLLRDSCNPELGQHHPRWPDLKCPAQTIPCGASQVFGSVFAPCNVSAKAAKPEAMPPKYYILRVNSVNLGSVPQRRFDCFVVCWIVVWVSVKCGIRVFMRLINRSWQLILKQPQSSSNQKVPTLLLEYPISLRDWGQLSVRIGAGNCWCILRRGLRVQQVHQISTMMDPTYWPSHLLSSAPASSKTIPTMHCSPFAIRHKDIVITSTSQETCNETRDGKTFFKCFIPLCCSF